MPAAGKLTLDGRPVAGAGLSFIPSGAGQTAVATTDEKGEFRCTTGNVEGAMPGTYKVVVLPPNVVDPKAKNAAIDGADYAKAMAQANRPAAKPKSDIPSKYSQAASTTLEVVIPADGSRSLELSMTK